jgi:hypothetical protein
MLDGVEALQQARTPFMDIYLQLSSVVPLANAGCPTPHAALIFKYLEFIADDWRRNSEYTYVPKAVVYQNARS